MASLKNDQMRALIDTTHKAIINLADEFARDRKAHKVEFKLIEAEFNTMRDRLQKETDLIWNFLEGLEMRVANLEKKQQL